MYTRQFQYILAVSEELHFERAAQKCFISQSTLSTMVGKFEDEIGLWIFDRSKKPVEITREGEAIIRQLQIIRSEIHHLDELVKELKGEVKGTLRIGCIPTVAPFLLPRFLPEFSRKYPDLNLIVRENTTPQILRKLKSRELDIGIVSVPNMEEELIEYPIYKEAFELYDYSGMHSVPLSAEELDLANFWLLEEGHCMRDQILEVCSRNRSEINSGLNIQFKAGSIDSLIRFVRANEGSTLLPALSLLDFSEKEKAHLIPFTAPTPSRKIGLIVHQHFVKEKLLRLLKEEIARSVDSFSEVSLIQ